MQKNGVPVGNRLKYNDDLYLFGPEFDRVGIDLIVKIISTDKKVIPKSRGVSDWGLRELTRNLTQQTGLADIACRKWLENKDRLILLFNQHDCVSN